jgi:hypothetical protein
MVSFKVDVLYKNAEEDAVRLHQIRRIQLSISQESRMSQGQSSAKVARPSPSRPKNLKKGEAIINIVDAQLDDNLRLSYNLDPESDRGGSHAMTRMSNALGFSAKRGHGVLLVKDPEIVQGPDGKEEAILTCLGLTSAHTPHKYHVPLPREDEDYEALCKAMGHEPVELVPGSKTLQKGTCVNVLKPIRLVYDSRKEIKVRELLIFFSRGIDSLILSSFSFFGMSIETRRSASH